MGDMNMVEYRRDTIGPSPLLKGRELRKWTLNENAGDLIDVWLEAVSSKRPWYTRQATYCGRLDQSRLDRCYITNRGEWLYLIDEMVHDGTSCLADHIPIKTREEVKAECADVWADHPWWATYHRKKWGLALARVRSVLLKQKKVQRADELEAEALYPKLSEVRIRVQEEPTTENRRLFEEESVENI
ncbi:hypothetical protein R1sor_002726 [Riccia sorocarpa]|uniref:Uncharacterized protein n=1 Tax=Riccia sorocarpa TaxID=122646 RepID=A0ABD3H2B4_9MARC